MAYASQSGRARTRPSNPEAFAVCQRHGGWVNRVDLINQMEWRGAALLPLNIWVCKRCLDVPQENAFRAIIIPSDPVPVYLPFPENFDAAESNVASLTTGASIDPTTGLPIPDLTTIGTVDGSPMTTEPYGRPANSDPNAIMPFATINGVVTEFDVLIPVLSVIANGSDQIAVTCSAPHGLVTGGMIAAVGLSNRLACGFFSVVVGGATSFSYQTYATSVPAGSLLASNARIVTANVGLPRSYSTIQQVGP